MKTAAAIPLSALCAALLAGCPIQGECGGEVEHALALTPEEYAKWQQGSDPAETTASPTTSAGGTSGGATDGSAADTGTGGSSTGGPLGPQEVCEAVCEHQYDGTLLSCAIEEQAPKVVVHCNVFYQCHEIPP